jgi:uncharacterized protein (DUF1778 family)
MMLVPISFDPKTVTPPPNGNWPIIVRCTYDDKRLIAEAAASLGMSTAQYMRSVLYQVSTAVLAELVAQPNGKA